MDEDCVKIKLGRGSIKGERDVIEERRKLEKKIMMEGRLAGCIPEGGLGEGRLNEWCGGK